MDFTKVLKSYEDMINNPNKLKKIRRRIIRSRLRKTCVANANTTLKVGTIVDDRVRPEDIKLIEVPIKQSHLSINLTDEAYEHMGDKISDTLDIQKESIYYGNEAAKKMKEILPTNDTNRR